MLKQNTTIYCQYPLRFLSGATLAGERVLWGQDERRNFYLSEAGINPMCAIPNGNLPPAVILMPQKAGGMASYKAVSGLATAPNINLAGGKNGAGILAGLGQVASANLDLLIFAIATITASGYFATNPIIRGKLEAVALLAGQGNLAASLGALVDTLATIAASGYFASDPVVQGKLEAIALLAGQGNLSAAIEAVIIATAVIEASGYFATDPAISGQFIAAATLAGKGDLVASLDALADAVAAIYATASIYASMCADGYIDATVYVNEGSADVAQMVAGVWNAVAAEFDGPGSTGEKLNDAGAAANPWTEDLPGSYAPGQAGYILGTNLDAAISDSKDELEGELAAIQTETDKIQNILDDTGAIDTRLPASPADQLLIDEHLGGILADMAFLKDIEGGRWRIVSNQMIFFAADNVTEVARFNLYDATGKPTMQNVFERRRV